MRRWVENQFRTFGKVYAWWRDQLTVVGKVIFLIMVCSLPTLADSDAAWAIVFMASSMILLVASVVGYLYRPRLAVTVTIPKNWMRSQSRVVALEITNRSRRPVYDLQLALLPEPQHWEVVQSGRTAKVLLPGQTLKLSSTLRALRRGLCELPQLQATTLFPLQLVRRSETYPLPRKALILPFYRELRSLDLAQSMPSLARGSNVALQTVGLIGQYVGSREYQPGVPVRKWDYPSWARLGQPVVREFSEPRHPSAAIILDTSFADQGPDGTELIAEMEAMLSLAAAITDALMARGNRIDLLALGDRLINDHDRTLSQDHPAILEHLAMAQPCGASGTATLAQELDRIPITWDLAIVLSHHWDAEQEHLFQTATDRHVTGRRVLVRDSDKASNYARHSMLWNLTTSQIEAGLVDLR